MFARCSALITMPKLSASIIEAAGNCYSWMFIGCTSLCISATETNEYKYPFLIRAGFESNSGYMNYVEGMFNSTGGTFTGTPTIDATYYLKNPPVE